MIDTPETLSLLKKTRHTIERFALTEEEIKLRDDNRELLSSIPFEELEPKLDSIIDKEWTVGKAISGDEEINTHPNILTLQEGEKLKKYIRKGRFGKAINYLQNHAGMDGQQKLNQALKPSENEEPTI